MNVPKLQQLANRRQELASSAELLSRFGLDRMDRMEAALFDAIVSSWSQVPNIESRFEQVRELFLKINAASEELRTIDSAIVAEVCSP